MSKPVPYAEWRAFWQRTQGMVMMAGADALALLDHAEACERLCRDFAALTPDHPPAGVTKLAWTLAIEKARELAGAQPAAVPA